MVLTTWKGTICYSLLLWVWILFYVYLASEWDNWEQLSTLLATETTWEHLTHSSFHLSWPENCIQVCLNEQSTAWAIPFPQTPSPISTSTPYHCLTLTNMLQLNDHVDRKRSDKNNELFGKHSQIKRRGQSFPSWWLVCSPFYSCAPNCRSCPFFVKMLPLWATECFWALTLCSLPSATCSIPCFQPCVFPFLCECVCFSIYGEKCTLQLYQNYGIDQNLQGRIGTEIVGDFLDKNK